MLKWNKLSLRTQLIIFFIIIQLIIFSVIYFYFSNKQSDFYINQLKIMLENEGKLIVSKQNIDLQKKSEKEYSPELDNWSKKWGKKLNARITIINKEGSVLADSTYDPTKMDNHINRPEIQEIIKNIKQDETGTAIRKSSTLGVNMLYFALPVYKNGETIGYLRLAKSLQEIRRVIWNNLKNYFLFFVILFFLSLILIWRFTSNLINPLRKMSKMTSEIANGNFKERIELKNHSNEIGNVAHKFNLMAEQLDKKIKEISREKNKVEAILSSMVDGVIATDEKLNIILLNPAARKMFSLKNTEANNKNLIKTLRNHRINELLEKALKNNETLSEEIIIQRGKEKIMRCHFAPITAGNNEIIGGVVVFTDITELRKLEQVRKDFVANVSHELKTPLTSIIGYVDTLIESKEINPETEKKFLHIIKDEADRLGYLIQDLLDLSKIEQNNPDLKAGNFKEVVDKTVSILQDKAAEKNIVIEKNFGKDLSPVLMIKKQMEQVMINLIDNAIKYTPEDGQIRIGVYDKGQNILVEVADNGIGIPLKKQERIFERFFRVDKARSRSLGGTGIGLSIVKHIVKGHNSEIKLDSNPGEGSKFYFYLKKAN